ncbi:MAG: dethiobiotin synthase [Chitinophagaceae bacterium]|jgi:dethiobiotin synthetase|nr:dethiobiotin synthase [Chitinophagaceae bacterium]MCA6447605.1 dethiobiotin synthase [Chitinophagaceae bacterium]
MLNAYFITGIGTDVGKTIVSAILAEALGAHYWKPIQAGFSEGTDTEKVATLVSHKACKFYAELYKLQLPASPHIAAREEKKTIEVVKLLQAFEEIKVKTRDRDLLIEGAGGLLVPLGDQLLVADFIKLLRIKVILVSRNYLGSINHSLLTAAFCRSNDIPVAGWIFTDTYMDYEEEIVKWSGYPKITNVPLLPNIDAVTIAEVAKQKKNAILQALHG